MSYEEAIKYLLSCGYEAHNLKYLPPFDVFKLASEVKSREYLPRRSAMEDIQTIKSRREMSLSAVDTKVTTIKESSTRKFVTESSDDSLAVKVFAEEGEPDYGLIEAATPLNVYEKLEHILAQHTEDGDRTPTILTHKATRAIRESIKNLFKEYEISISFSIKQQLDGRILIEGKYAIDRYALLGIEVAYKT